MDDFTCTSAALNCRIPSIVDSGMGNQRTLNTCFWTLPDSGTRILKESAIIRRESGKVHLIRAKDKCFSIEMWFCIENRNFGLDYLRDYYFVYIRKVETKYPRKVLLYKGSFYSLVKSKRASLYAEALLMATKLFDKIFRQFADISINCSHCDNVQ